jgi:hypothetical protein
MTSTLAPGRNAVIEIVTGQMLNWAVWVMFAVSFVVYIEPAPADVMFAVVILLFIFQRLTAAICLMPLLMMLVIYNFGGFLTYIHAPPEPQALMFIVTSAYMALSAVVFAFYVAANPTKNMNIIGRAWSIGAVFASIWGMIDYFNLPSPFPLQVLPGRATGLFKDPNVYSTYLIFPMIFMLQNLVLGTSRRPALTSLALGICMIGLFLSFSRGAWANFVVAAMMLFSLTFVLYANGRLRMRLIIYIVGGVAFAAVAFMVLMSIPTIQKMFIARFSLVQSYDAGETGRFGNQIRSIPELLRLPLGYGPHVFGKLYGQAPHNVFVNAFSAYGWLGGVTYFLLIITTIYAGLKTILVRTPWQGLSIAVFSAMSAVIFQGVQIDTDHWRHFYWMLGMTWGLFAITVQPGHMVRNEKDAQRLGTLHA